MSMTSNQFERRFLKAINNGSAAIFAGAGLSIPAGFLNWKELLRDFAEELNLDIDKETDLISLAQYYVNSKTGRSTVNQKLIDEFASRGKTTENLEILTSLPIKYYWTTNYDKLIEETLHHTNKKVDVKITPENLATSVYKSDAIIYKMHGDISQADKAVLTKEDYENYDEERSLFTTALKGDLVTKTFLFIGFSFDDPNLDYILSRIRILLGGNKREHFCFLKKPLKSDFSKSGLTKKQIDADFDYARRKQEYRIKDLERYSIYAVLVDDYTEITSSLKSIRSKYQRQNIFISGSAISYSNWTEAEAQLFLFELSSNLIKPNWKVVTGFGRGVGSFIINGVLSKMATLKYADLDEYLIMRPFPQEPMPLTTLKSQWTDYRNTIISICGFSIFVFGNKKLGSDIVESDGMLEEFEISIKKGLVAIPVAVTGYASYTIWEKMNLDLPRYGYNTPDLKRLFKSLNNKSLNRSELIFNIIEIINKLN